MSEHEKPWLEDVGVWLVSDGTASREGWQEALLRRLKEAGASSAEVYSVSGAVSTTARGMLEQGAERIARTLRLSGNGREEGAFEALSRYRPEVILVDNAAALRPLSMLREVTPLRPLIVAVVSDEGAVSSWGDARPDAWIAPSVAQLDEVRAGSLVDDAYQLGGPPVDEAFVADVDRDAVRAELNLSGESKLAFVDTSTMPPALIERVVYQLRGLGDALDVIFYYGRNPDAPGALRSSARAHRLRARMLGETSNHARFSSAADIGVVGRACPHTSAYLAAGLPLIAVDPDARFHAGTRSGAIVPLPGPDSLGAIFAEVAARGVAEGHLEAAARERQRDRWASFMSALRELTLRRADLAGAVKTIATPTGTASVGGAAPQNSPGPFEVIGDDSALTPEQAPKRARMTRAQAHQELSRLIRQERSIQERLENMGRERDSWLKRREYAREDGEADLERYAETQIDKLMDAIRRENETLGRIADEKDAVRQSVVQRAERKEGGAAPASDASAQVPDSVRYEARFRDLEMRRQLDDLRRRADKGDEPKR